MAQLVLLVLAAVWLAVLVPPLLRSRVENRPNSSVTDFRRQLTKLQNTATPPRGAVRAMGRPLAQSPLTRPVAAGRTGQPTLRSGLTWHPSPSAGPSHPGGAGTPRAPRPVEPVVEAPRQRSHGDPSGGRRRPPRDATATRGRARRAPSHGVERMRRDRDGHVARAHGEYRRSTTGPADRDAVKRRRANVLFALVVSAACTLFLAATTASDVMTYLFMAVFAGLCAYVYLLAQANQRTTGRSGWPAGAR